MVPHNHGCWLVIRFVLANLEIATSVFILRCKNLPESGN